MLETLGKCAAIYTKVNELVRTKPQVIAVQMCAGYLFLVHQWFPPTGAPAESTYNSGNHKKQRLY